MAWADEVREIESHDAMGNKATFNIRVDKEGNRVTSGNQVEIGTHYESVSRKSFFN
jgi:thymidine kinase